MLTVHPMAGAEMAALSVWPLFIIYFFRFLLVAGEFNFRFWSRTCGEVLADATDQSPEASGCVCLMSKFRSLLGCIRRPGNVFRSILSIITFDGLVWMNLIFLLSAPNFCSPITKATYNFKLMFRTPRTTVDDTTRRTTSRLMERSITHRGLSAITPFFPISFLVNISGKMLQVLGVEHTEKHNPLLDDLSRHCDGVGRLDLKLRLYWKVLTVLPQEQTAHRHLRRTVHRTRDNSARPTGRIHLSSSDRRHRQHHIKIIIIIIIISYSWLGSGAGCCFGRPIRVCRVCVDRCRRCCGAHWNGLTVVWIGRPRSVVRRAQFSALPVVGSNPGINPR